VTLNGLLRFVDSRSCRRCFGQKGIRYRRKSSLFGLKTGLFGLKMGQKTGFAVTNQLTGIKSQVIDSLVVTNDLWVENSQKVVKRGVLFSVDSNSGQQKPATLVFVHAYIVRADGK